MSNYRPSITNASVRLKGYYQRYLMYLEAEDLGRPTPSHGTFWFLVSSACFFSFVASVVAVTSRGAIMKKRPTRPGDLSTTPALSTPGQSRPPVPSSLSSRPGGSSYAAPTPHTVSPRSNVLSSGAAAAAYAVSPIIRGGPVASPTVFDLFLHHVK